MSKFCTRIPTEVAALLATIPKGSTVDGIALDPESHEIIVLWQNTSFESGLTVPVDFAFPDVKAKRLPKGVLRGKNPHQAALTQPEKKDAPTANVAPNKGLPVYLSEEQVEQLVKDGKPVEFMGVNPAWQSFNPKQDTFTDGYFYRQPVGA